jgi:hypothetical protein
MEIVNQEKIPQTAAQTVAAQEDKFVLTTFVNRHNHQEMETIQKGGMTSQTAGHPRDGHATQTIIPNL